jgi:hypothetical protein
MDIFNNSISLDNLTGEQDKYYDLVLQHTKINQELKTNLWSPDKCLSITFDRCWDIEILNKFLSTNFVGIKYLQILCDNYMTTRDGKPYNFENFPNTITHLHIRCATYHKSLGFISIKHLERTNLEWLMLHGRVEETDYKLPETLTIFIRACMNTDHEKRICLTQLCLDWHKTSDIRARLPDLDFRGNRCGFMEVYTK